MLLEQGLNLLHIKYNSLQIQKLVFFFSELEKWNKRFHFIKAKGEELVVRHIFDSLAGVHLLNRYCKQGQLIDVGSGVGFPGIPLSIFMNKSFITLCESRAKRAAFLRNVCLLGNLTNVEVEECDFKNIAVLFDVLLFRAFSKIKKQLPAFSCLLKNKGIIFAYKGTLIKVLEEVKDLCKKIYHIKIHPLTVPFLKAERHALIINATDII